MFADDMILQKILTMLPGNQQSSSMNLVKLQDTKLIQRNLFHSYTLAMKYHKEKLFKNSNFPLYQKE